MVLVKDVVVFGVSQLDLLGASWATAAQRPPKGISSSGQLEVQGAAFLKSVAKLGKICEQTFQHRFQWT